MDNIIQSHTGVWVRIKKSKRSRLNGSGQSLVEYALILVFVSLAVLVVASLIGLAVQRIYGVVGGAVGASHSNPCAGGASCDHNTRYLTISSATCYISSVGGNTTFVIRGEISIPEANTDPNYDINLSTDNGIFATRSNPGGANAMWTIDGAVNGLLYVNQLTTGANASLCPHSATVQTHDLIAVSPVSVMP